MKVGDLVQDFPDEIERFSPRFGIVVKVTACGDGMPDDVEVCFGGEIEEWGECEIAVVNESR